ncbi:hypothetical protein [Flavobacterium sp.]|uniref:hypothetical protein n=1 Tax=Flavobacterium sp. TaxID=239 RepID=UPI00286CFC6F|nr:hypothetical protein [Flavobacterium sp.]
MTKGAKDNKSVAYLLFNSDNSKAEVFLPKNNKGIVLTKSKHGNWIFEGYTLISWKGYVLQENGISIFGGE